MNLDQYRNSLSSIYDYDRLAYVLCNDPNTEKYFNHCINEISNALDRINIEPNILNIRLIYFFLDKMDIDKTLLEKYCRKLLSLISRRNPLDMDNYTYIHKYVISNVVFSYADANDLKSKASDEILRRRVLGIEDSYVYNDLGDDIENIIGSKYIDILENNISVDALCDIVREKYQDFYDVSQCITVATIVYHKIRDIHNNSISRDEFISKIVNNINEYNVIDNVNSVAEKLNDYFGEDSLYGINIVKVLYEDYKPKCQKGLNPSPAQEKTLGEFKYKLHYEIIPILISLYIRDADNVELRSSAISQIIKSAISFKDADSNMIAGWIYDVYLPKFTYDGPSSIEEKYNIEEVVKEATGLGPKKATKLKDTEKKVYKAYKTYKDKEEAVDNQVTSMVSTMKKKFTGDPREAVIGGKKYTVLGVLKRALGTAAIFAYSKIGGILYFVTRYALNKKRSLKERKKIIMELETEIKMIDEKIEDARGDGNRDAKYAMMRTKSELENALQRIKFGLEADDKSISSAKKILSRK